jgi:hypothetical protein
MKISPIRSRREQDFTRHTRYRESTVRSLIAAISTCFVQGPIAVGAGTVDGTKTIVWSFKGGTPPDGATGTYDWGPFKAEAHDKHINSVKPDGKDGDPPGHDKWTLSDGLKTTSKDTTEAGKTGEPNAHAHLDFAAEKPVTDEHDKTTLTATIHALAQADLAPDDKEQTMHGAQNVLALAIGTMHVSSGTMVSRDVVSPNGSVVDKPNELVDPKGGQNFSASNTIGKLEDPVSLTLTDLTRGVSVTKDLFSIDIAAHGSAMSS